MQEVLPLQNGLVSAFNVPIMACEPANQACVQLSCTCAAKGTCFYCWYAHVPGHSPQPRLTIAYSKYVSKDANQLTATAGMLIAAEDHCKKYKSRAADAETSSLRAARYLLTNTVNRVVSAMEVSDQQVRYVVERLVVAAWNFFFFFLKTV